MIRVVFIDLEVWKEPERVFKIGAIRRDLENIDDFSRIEGKIGIPEDKNMLKDGCFKDEDTDCDCFYVEIDRKKEEKDYTKDAEEAFEKLKSFSLKNTDKPINEIYLCGHNIIRFDSKYIEEYWNENNKPELRINLEDKTEEEIRKYKYIDTLTVSPLIFPEFPSHKLNKDYKHESEKDDLTVNNPVEDSRICMNLLFDQIERLEWMSENSRDLVETMIKLVHSGDSRDEKGDLIVQWDNLLNLIHTLNEKSMIPKASLSDEEISEEVLLQNVKNLIEAENGSLYGQVCIHGMDKVNYAKERKWQVPLAYMLANIYANSKMDGNEEPINNAIIPYYVQYRYKGIDRINWDLRGIQCDDKNCLYCHNEAGKSSERFDPETNLKKYWGEKYGFRRFPMYDWKITEDGKPKDQQKKDLQRDATKRALKGGNMLAIFPTGGGKSLSFQLPALMQWRLMGALTVVISPLQSLMNDQVKNLDESGLVGEAVTRNGSQNERKQRAGIIQARNGSASMLYISPESLKNPGIKSILLSRTIARFVIDESHCFSQWGMDFRPDYRDIPKFIKEIEKAKGLDELGRPGIPVSCFTATASNITRDDIRNSFKSDINETNDLFALKDIYVDSQRTNLNYHLIRIPRPAGVKPEDLNREMVFEIKFERLKELLLDINEKDQTEPIIIYISNTEKTKDIADRICNDEKLKKIGKARPFHGQQSRTTKNKTQTMFMNGECRIIVATSAFGMGVDKDNVRNVIHFGISNSVEDYVQEAGRAGRDNKSADCHLLYMEDEDLAYVEFLSESSKLRFDIIQKVWKYLNDLVSEAQKKNDEPRVGYTISKIITAIQDDLPVENGRRENREYVRRILDFLVDKGYLESLPDAVSAFPTKINENAANLIKGAFSENPLMKKLAEYVVDRIRTYKIEGNIKEVGDLYSDLFIYAKNNEDSIKKNITLDDINYLFREMEKRSIITCEEERELVIEKPSKMSGIDPGKILDAWEITELEMFEKLSKKSYSSYSELKADSEKVTDGKRRLEQVYRFWIDHRYINRPKNSSISFVAFSGSNQGEASQNKKNEQDIRNRILNRYENAKTIYNNYKESKEFYTISEIQGFFDKTPDIGQLEEALDILARAELLSIDDGGMIFRRKSYALIKKNHGKKIDEKDFEELKNYYELKDKQVSMYLPVMTDQMEKGNLTQFFHDYFWEDRDVFDAKFEGSLSDRNNLNDVSDAIDVEKQAVLDDTGSNVIIVKAGPGSGKTRLMVLKAERMIRDKEAKPGDIVMLTYTRKAADEIRSRLKNNMMGITVTTFHSYAASIKGEPGSIEDEYLKNTAILLNDATNNPDGFVSRTMPKMPEMDAVCKKVIIIDEAQDMNKDMFDLILNLYKLNRAIGNRMKICAVGDPDQAIFFYTREDSDRTDYMSKLAELDKDNAKTYQLNKNYRSSQAIVELSRYYIGKEFKKKYATVDDKATIGVYKYEYPETALVEKLIKDLSQKDTNREIGVLCYTNKMKYELMNRIKHRIGCTLQGRDISIHDLKKENHEDFTLDMLDEFHSILRRISMKLEETDGDVKWEEIKGSVLPDFKKAYRNSRHCNRAIDLVKEYFVTMEDDEIFGKEEYENLLNHLESIPFRVFEEAITKSKSKKKKGQSIDLTVSTIHSAKGREFDAVYIYHDGYCEKIEKKVDRVDAIKELYVAMTRAKSELYIFSPKIISLPQEGESINERIESLKKCNNDSNNIDFENYVEINDYVEDEENKSVYMNFLLDELYDNQYMDKWWKYQWRGGDNTNPLIKYKEHFHISLKCWEGFFDDSPQWMQAGVCKARFVRTRYEYFSKDDGYEYPGLIWLEIKVDDKTKWGKKECCNWKNKQEEIESCCNRCKEAASIQGEPNWGHRDAVFFSKDSIPLCENVAIRAVVVKEYDGFYRKYLLP